MDPITGAMFKLKPEEIEGNLKNGTTVKTEDGTMYIQISMDIDPNWEKVGQLENQNERFLSILAVFHTHHFIPKNHSED